MREAGFYRLKAAQQELVQLCGGQARAGTLIGVTQSAVSQTLARESGTTFSAEVVRRLEADCGRPVVSRVLCELAGGSVAGPAPAPDAGCAFSAHAAVMQEVADLCATFSVAVADGRFSRTDAAGSRRALVDLRGAIERFERVCAAAEAAGPS